MDERKIELVDSAQAIYWYDVGGNEYGLVEVHKDSPDADPYRYRYEVVENEETYIKLLDADGCPIVKGEDLENVFPLLLKRYAVDKANNS